MKRFLMIAIAIMATTLADATAASAPAGGEGGALAGADNVWCGRSDLVLDYGRDRHERRSGRDRGVHASGRTRRSPPVGGFGGPHLR